jgi:glycosyltransferase involved in cell wall biosynthesis
MKLLHCLNSPKIGGIERLVIDLAVEQKSKGIDVTIMLDNIDGAYYKIIIENEIDVMMSGVQSGFEMSLFKCHSLKKQFKNFDIIHFHHFSFIKSMAAMSLNTVYTIHGLSKDVRKENKIKYYLREYVKSFSLNKVSFFVANSKYTLRLAKKHYGLQKVKCNVILNGINVENNEKIIPKLNNEYFTIGLVTRFINRKRIDRLIIAFKYFIEMGGVGKLVLVGNGEVFNKIETSGIFHTT